MRTDAALRAEHARLERNLVDEHGDLGPNSRGTTVFVGLLLDRARERDDLAFDIWVPTLD
ncbi:hypothetical protein [Halovivax sp.]|uniref:hypothetical protein n=1 Tax=Halovivax sp. TaxID=1935978 RepID=UPI0025BA39FE|nr:hypothetical protein [Halovivax sp.]